MNTYNTFITFVFAATIIGLFCLPVASKWIGSLVSPYPKPNINKRLLAAGLDAAICLICYAVFAPSNLILASISGTTYILIKDGLLSGQSIGKAFVGLVVIQLGSGEPCTIIKSIKRNILLAIPGLNIAAIIFEAFAIHRDEQGVRLGDKFAKTQVVEGIDVKDLVKKFQEQFFTDFTQLDETPPLRPEPAENQAA